MELLQTNTSPRIRYAKLHGREHIVAPLSLIVPGVLAGSMGPLHYPPEEVSRDPSIWNHVPIVVYHPSVNGQNVSARDPDILDQQGIGVVLRSRYNGQKLIAEGWFDVERTSRIDNRIMDSLLSGKPIELSTGLFTENEPAPQGATFNGRPYSFVARGYRPDHLAVLPDQIGACSLRDGCGVLVNGGCGTGAGGFKSGNTCARGGAKGGTKSKPSKAAGGFEPPPESYKVAAQPIYSSAKGVSQTETEIVDPAAVKKLLASKTPVEGPEAAKLLDERQKRIWNNDPKTHHTDAKTFVNGIVLSGSYFGTSKSVQINAGLRNGNWKFNEYDKKWTEDLIKDFNKKALPTPVEIKAYRAIQGNPAKILNGGKPLAVGDVFTDKGFVSTTLDQKYMRSINLKDIRGHMSGPSGPKTVMEVSVPKGTKAVFHSKEGESEMLLGNGSQFRVVSVKPFKVEAIDRVVENNLLVNADAEIEPSNTVGSIDPKQRFFYVEEEPLVPVESETPAVNAGRKAGTKARWVTLKNGVHIQIDKKGRVIGGPKGLVSKLNEKKEPKNAGTKEGSKPHESGKTEIDPKHKGSIFDNDIKSTRSHDRNQISGYGDKNDNKTKLGKGESLSAKSFKKDKMTIDQAAAGLEKKGYKLEKQLDSDTGKKAMYQVKGPDGKSKSMSSSDIKELLGDVAGLTGKALQGIVSKVTGNVDMTDQEVQAVLLLARNIDAMKTLEQEERNSLIGAIIGNCGCSAEDVDALSSMTDKSLLRMARNSMPPQFRKAKKKPAVPHPDSESGAEDATDTTSEEEEQMTTEHKKMAANSSQPEVKKPQTYQEWLDSAPPEVRVAVTNALKIEKREKDSLIEKLTANVKNEDVKKRLMTKYANNSIDELNDMLFTLSEQPAKAESQPLFFGQNSPIGNSQVGNVDRNDILPLPRMTWEKIG